MQKLVDEVNHPDATATAPAGDVMETVHAIMHLFRSRQLRGLRDKSHDRTHDLAHMEIKVLGFFARRPRATQSELVAHSGRDKAQVARLIRGLRERGLLAAEADADDRRSTRLRLSEEGRGVFRELHRHDGRLAAVALDGLSAQERETLASLLGRVKTNLEAGDA